MAQESIPAFPERVGPYRIREAIGTGGMATVYLAERVGEAGGRWVALKLVHAHLRAQPEVALELLEEAKLTARIRHPRVVSVLEFGEDPNGMYLVLDYVDGVSLADLTALATRTDTPLDPGAGVEVLADALEGLQAAHDLVDASGQSVGLVHRDFTPHNILVGTDGFGRLSDFGIAKAQIRAQTTKEGFVKGKAGYMSPEQVRGREVDRRCDVWAAGIIAWEVIAGRRLYDVDDVNSLFRIVAEDPPKLSTVRPEVAPSVEAVVSRALSRSVDQRYPTADEFRRALLEAWTSNVPLPPRSALSAEVERARLARPKVVFKMAKGGTQPSAERPLTAPAPVKRGPAKWLPVGIGVALAGVLAFALSRLRTPPSTGPALPATVVRAPVSPVVTRPGPPHPPPPVAPRAPEPVVAAPPGLAVYANAKLRQVRLNARVVLVNPPAAETRVTLQPGEQGAALRLEALAIDGRKVEMPLAPGQDRLLVEFPVPRPKLPTVPVGVAPPPLAGNPYESVP